MKDRIRLFIESLKLVWQSSPSWTVANILISVLRSVLPLIIILFIKNLIDVITQATAKGLPFTPSIVIMPLIVVVITWFIDEAAGEASQYIRKKQTLFLELHMYSLLHDKAVKLDLINFEHPDYYDCISRAAREALWRPNNILNNSILLFRAFLSLLLISGLLLTLNWSILILLLLANSPGVWLRLHYAGVLYTFQRKQTPEARKAAYYNWLLTGDRPSREVRLFGLGKYFRELFVKSFLKQKNEEADIIRKKTIIGIISEIFKAAAFFAALLFIARQTITGKLSLGQMAMFLLAFRQGMIYIKELFSSLAGLYEDGLFIADTFEFLNLEEKISANSGLKFATSLGNEIRVENISFRYPGNEKAALRNINLEIKKGQIVALVGPNGAGKSTLVRLLCRLYEPDSGKIVFDDTDIRNYDPESYRKMFSVVFQDFMLYNLSAGENIRIGDIESHADIKDEVKKAAVEAGIAGIVESLPESYDTNIGNLFENSRELSWGEWQKIAIARALFRNSPVLILDEPSSSLDAEAEYEIFSRFSELVRNRTTILISHRLLNVALADKIIVLDKGNIAESGTHDELMSAKGLYYDMYTKQSSRFKR